MTDIPAWAMERAERFCNENEPSTEAIARLILSVQRETVERCAEVAEKTHYMHSSHQYYRSAAINIAAAIRALTAKD